jgi:NAD(P)H-nitrite reductase large subunit
MSPDDELCLCFHVTRRKVENFIRLERPQRVGQMAECFGAGTGCGWCRPFLERLFEAGQRTSLADDVELPSPDQYAQGRTHYVRAGGGTPPPGATPLGDEV